MLRRILRAVARSQIRWQILNRNSQEECRGFELPRQSHAGKLPPSGSADTWYLWKSKRRKAKTRFWRGRKGQEISIPPHCMRQRELYIRGKPKVQTNVLGRKQDSTS